MKYNTISTSSLASERPKSTLTIYADMDLSQNKMLYTEDQVSSIRGELEIVQKALKLQTRRCRQLVAEYTRRLQEKEQQYHNERTLRDNQLAKVLRALLIFEARLKQEQKFISHQLNEKDYIINKQKNHIKKLLSSNLFCKNCNNAYVTSPVQESLDSSSEYYVGESNLESLDSSSIYSTLSEKGKSDKSDEDTTKYKKNNSGTKKVRKLSHKKSNGTYFEVLKLRNESNSPFSNEDNTSNDYDNLDSLPTESITSKINWVSDNIEAMFAKNKQDLEERISKDPSKQNNPSNLTQENVKASEDNFKDQEVDSKNLQQEPKNKKGASEEKPEDKPCKITDSIQVFEGGNDEENNENWYASASDQEDDTQRNIYRNNPVLECMNQILLQNINDPLNSPPKTPSVERKNKNNKRVKFSDEEDAKETNNDDGEAKLTKENLKKDSYYETPIQKTPNFYETPQSIYSNDYEQILSSKEELVDKKPVVEAVNHFYVDMEAKSEDNPHQERVRKTKILRAPPALPPKPANLVSKYKLKPKVDLEPDYCSISELNLPTKKANVSFKKISVVAEINSPSSNDVRNKLEKAAVFNKNKINDYDPVIVSSNSEKLVVKKCVEKLNIQIAKQTNIKDPPPKSPSRKVNVVEDVPKLPQVSEIIIPDEEEEDTKEKERITQDNYVKNNSQILKYKMENRRPMYISSISNLINNFNGKSSEKKKSPPLKSPDKFSSFDNQNNDKLQATNNKPEALESTFDLSQTFEEFKLDDCEIEEYDVENADSLKDDLPICTNSDDTDSKSVNIEVKPPVPDRPSKTNTEVSTKSDFNLKSDLEVPRLNKSSIELLKKQLQLSKGGNDVNNKFNNETNYEHFLECTGLSSKSILTSSRLLSNHKSMLKPKDVKLRSKTKNLIERNSSGSSIKYWSEPYI